MSNVVPHASGSVRTRNIDPRILLLALAAFALSTDALVMIGVMPTIAREMQITEGVAGQLITAFSLTYALAGPVLATLTSSLPRNRVLIVALFAFCLANLGAALSPTICFPHSHSLPPPLKMLARKLYHVGGPDPKC
jgi:Arabinose efflux permease